MKKLVVALTALMIVCCLGVTAFATDLATPFDDSTLKIAVIESFDNTAAITGAYLGIPDGAVALDNETFTAAYGLDGGKFSIKDGAPGTAWAGILDRNLAGMNASAEGFGFYVKNDNDADVSMVFALLANEAGSLNATAYTIGSEKDYALIAIDGTKEVVTAPVQTNPYSGAVVHSSFTIPAGFEGFVCVPFSATQVIWGTDVMNANVQITGFGWMGTNSKLEFDNIFVYGANVTESNANLILDAIQDTADLSVIAYAVAAITGCGALVVARKRK
ncbi:MAG: hypothetical protein PUC05_08440 [Firmicutes bacterium]|nr:hypothetical protein [Bacillota bacterium]